MSLINQARRFDVIHPSLSASQRRSYQLEDPSILSAEAAVPLINGEWLEIAAGQKAKRGTGNASVASYPYFGSDPISAQTTGQVTLLDGPHRAKTAVFKSDASYAVGTKLMVGSVTAFGLTRRALLPQTGDTKVVAVVEDILDDPNFGNPDAGANKGKFLVIRFNPAGV